MKDRKKQDLQYWTKTMAERLLQWLEITKRYKICYLVICVPSSFLESTLSTSSCWWITLIKSFTEHWKHRFTFHLKQNTRATVSPINDSWEIMEVAAASLSNESQFRWEKEYGSEKTTKRETKTAVSLTGISLHNSIISPMIIIN